jgi:mono/diheme cytochrome c family protein
VRLPIDRPPLRWFAAVLLSTVLGSGASADDPSFTAATDARRVGGAEIYSHICQGCHMPEAQGAVGAGHYPKLAGNPALVSWQYVALTVLHGKKGMPAFGLPNGAVVDFLAVQLSDADVADVVNYVRSNFGNHYKGGITAKQVAALPHAGVAASDDSVTDHR